MNWLQKVSVQNQLKTLESLGYHFRHNRVKGMYTSIVVYYENIWVGEATFNEKEPTLNSDEMYASNAWVDRKHQRKGIASAMYNLAEQLTGKKIIRTTNQTPDAAAFWDNNPDRSFGK